MIYKVKHIETDLYIGLYSINGKGKQWKRKFAAVDALIKYTDQHRLDVSEFDLEVYEMVHVESLDTVTAVEDRKNQLDTQRHDKEVAQLQAKRNRLLAEEQRIAEELKKLK